MSTVWMRHPDLPPEQLIAVDEASVPHHRSAGWVVTTAPTTPKFQDDNEDAPDAGDSAPEPAPEKPRRRAPKEAEQ